MTFRELLQDNTLWADAFVLVSLKYEELHVSPEDVIDTADITSRYTKVIMQLLSYPYNPHDYVINLEIVPVDKFNEVEYVDVSLVDSVQGVAEDLSALPWREIVDLDIVVGFGLDHYTDSDLLSELLWELTTWGFDSEVSSNGKDLFSDFLSGFLRDDLDRN